MRDSNLTLERVYAMLAEFLIELKLPEEQDKMAQIAIYQHCQALHV